MMRRAKNDKLQQQIQRIREIINEDEDVERQYQELMGREFPSKITINTLSTIFPNKILTRSGRHFNMTKLKRYIDKNSAVRAYLNMPLNIDINNEWVGNEETLSKFELVLLCVERELLPSHYNERVYIDNFPKKELIYSLKNNRMPVEIRNNNVRFVENLPANIVNLKNLHYLETGNHLDSHIDFHNAQLAIGIQTPILPNLEKNIALADRVLNDDDPYVYDTSPSSLSCDKFGIPSFPNSTRELREMDSLGLTEEYNYWGLHYENFLRQNPRRIRVKNPVGNYTNLGVYKRLKFLAESLNRQNEIPSGTSADEDLNLLLTYLRYIENS